MRELGLIIVAIIFVAILMAETKMSFLHKVDNHIEEQLDI